MKISCIIQARTGSTRLPRKILIRIVDKEVLTHVIDRTLNSRKIDDIVIATTVEPEDEEIVRLVKSLNNPRVSFFRGSKDDVLDRYYKAAKNDHSDIIIRITSDCPLIDWEVLDNIIDIHLKGKYDYTSNVLSKRTFPRGLDVEVFNFSVLEYMWKNCSRQSEREHVTTFVRENPDEFKTFNFENNTDLSDMRWTLDEDDDLKLIRNIYERLYSEKKAFKTSDVLELMMKHPELKMINKHVEQKKNVNSTAN